MKKYPKYKSSGISWLGDIPEHWEVRRNKYIFQERNEKSVKGTEELLTVSQYTGITKRKDKVLGENKLLTNASSLEGYKTVHKNDLVINIMLAWNGSLGISPYHGITSPAYSVFSIRNKNENFSNFFHYTFRTKIYHSIFKTVSTGVIDSRLRLYPDDFFKLTTLLPPLQEQIQIARFLDWKVGQINKFIKTKKHILELLKEQKQVIINDVVTGKIDVRTGKPYPKYKASAVEWLGDIPEEWEVLPIKRLSKAVKTGSTPPGADDKYYSSEGINWFTPGDFSDETELRNSKRQLSALGVSAVNIFPPKTVYMNGIGSIGKVGICLDSASCNQQINAIITNEKISPYYLLYCIKSAKQFIISFGKFTTLPIINQEETKSLIFPVPSKDGQKVIVSYIQEKTEATDRAISRIEREIELIKEYKERLIADVVTGILAIRGVEVPEVIEDIEEELPEDEPEEIENKEGVE
ncbi:MAG: restriction endonuclease subunit S [Ignavibacteria bacterium]|nr:restriction endonuclease subunit S [Ignavibacteria bacterium]